MAYVADAVWSFGSGLLAPVLVPREIEQDIGWFIPDSSVLAASVTAFAAMASAVTVYAILRAIADQERMARATAKLIVVALPSLAIGILTALVLGWMGVWRVGQPRFFLFSAVAYMCAGISGFAAISRMPQYKDVLRWSQRDRE
ncbi:MAG: hypothetical protein GXP27_16750 [Planctomycetes bacterium]|nr:hypothetical protein [Planctomycetota bacterium]